MVAVKRELYSWDAVTDIRDSYGAGKETFRIDVDQDRAALYGLTEREVGQAVRTAVDGIVAAEFSDRLMKLIEETDGSERDADRGFLTAGGVFDDDMIDGYLELKAEEVQTLDMTTHPVEFDMYYSV